jgi:hypothetical protein
VLEQKTTRENGQPVEAVGYDLKGLMNIMQDLKAQRDALQKRVAWLEERLEQRHEETRKDFERMQPYLENMRAKIRQIFLDLPPTVGLTHQEIQDEFHDRYPMVSITNVPRRVRELVEQGDLWSKTDDEGTVRFYLKLKEVEKS